MVIAVLIGDRPGSTGNNLDLEAASLHGATTKEPNPRTIVSSAYIDQEADHVHEHRPADLCEPRDASWRLALARDYWLHLSHHHGDDRLSEPALFSLQARSLAQ